MLSFLGGRLQDSLSPLLVEHSIKTYCDYRKREKFCAAIALKTLLIRVLILRLVRFRSRPILLLLQRSDSNINGSNFCSPVVNTPTEAARFLELSEAPSLVLRASLSHQCLLHKAAYTTSSLAPKESSLVFLLPTSLLHFYELAFLWVWFTTISSSAMFQPMWSGPLNYPYISKPACTAWHSQAHSDMGGRQNLLLRKQIHSSL